VRVFAVGLPGPGVWFERGAGLSAMWALEEACRTSSRWQRVFPSAPALAMAVNLSARQLASHSLVADVAAIVADSGIDPSKLLLEMTETVL
jgi:EAL domain-containing protein (putative c-di-GMP-specific phosphodiesterase class I)